MTLLELLKIIGKLDIEVIISPNRHIVGNAYDVELVKRTDNDICRQCFTFDLNGVADQGYMVNWLFYKNIDCLDDRITIKHLLKTQPKS